MTSSAVRVLSCSSRVIADETVDEGAWGELDDEDDEDNRPKIESLLLGALGSTVDAGGGDVVVDRDGLLAAALVWAGAGVRVGLMFFQSLGMKDRENMLC